MKIRNLLSLWLKPALLMLSIAGFTLDSSANCDFITRFSPNTGTPGATITIGIYAPGAFSGGGCGRTITGATLGTVSCNSFAVINGDSMTAQFTLPAIYSGWSGTLTVLGTVPNGNSNNPNVSGMLLTNFSIPQIISNPSICLVTVDSTGHNQIIFEKEVTTKIDSFFIYRETNVTGTFVKIGGTKYQDYSVFTDTGSHPAVSSNQYEISAKANVGNFVTNQSSAVQTMHLNINKGQNTSWNLIWNNYVGGNFPTYNIYRGTSQNNMTMIGSVASSVTSYTDLNPPNGINYYLIEIVSTTSCNPTARVSSFASSKSNIAATTSTSGIHEERRINAFKAFPNPSNGTVMISMDESSSGTYEIYNGLGAKLLSGSFITGSFNLSPIDFHYTRGIYFLKVKAQQGSSFGKLIIE